MSKTDMVDFQSGEQPWPEQLHEKVSEQRGKLPLSSSAVHCSTVQCSAVGFFASRERFSVKYFAYVVGGRVGMGVTHYVVR